MDNSTPIFSHYQKTLLFGEQCKVEWDLAEQEYHTRKLMLEFPDLASQLLENFKLIAYNEWKKSWKKIDRFGGALWRQGYE